jgi:hypothetical protein
MSSKSVPFTCIPDLAKEKLRLGDDLSFHLFENDGSLSMIVEATRLGSDKRKITGFANMSQYQILRLWAGLDKLIKERGLASEVQTEDEHVKARMEQNKANEENFQRNRQRFAPSHKTHDPEPEQNIPDAQESPAKVLSHAEVADYIMEMEARHQIDNDDDSIGEAVAQVGRTLRHEFSDLDIQEISAHIMSTKRRAAVVKYVLDHGMLGSKSDDQSLGHKVRHAAAMLDIELSDAESQSVYDDLLSC